MAYNFFITNEVERFFATRVVPELNLHGWTISWNGDPWCSKSNMRIYMRVEATLDDTLQLLLHEATHATVSCEGHPLVFWQAFDSVLKSFGFSGMNEHFAKMRTDYTEPLTPEKRELLAALGGTTR